jgi:hypothetical protein
MALLGFALVFIADGLDRIASRTGEVDGIVDKVLDRLLDRDIPRRERSVEPSPPAPKPASTGGDVAPRAATARADVDAPSPEDYAKESVGKRAAQNASAAPTRAQKNATVATPVEKAAPRDLDALVERVTRGL